MDIQKSIRLSMAIKDINGVELAEKVGISSGTLSLIKSSKRNPSIGTIRKMAKALDMKVSEFIALGE